MQQLEIVYSGIKGAILVRKSSGPPTEELPLFNLKGKVKKANHVPFPYLQCVRQSFYTAVITVLNRCVYKVAPPVY